jgi:hypothetical protein
MFCTRRYSYKVYISVTDSQWHTALYRLERSTLLLDDPIELRKLIPSATNIYNKYKTLYQRDAIIRVQKFIIRKINLLENTHDTSSN